jgi:hypothetical protein
MGMLLFRIYFRGGDHPGRWREFRSFGLLASARFDHHPEPWQLHESCGILYAASRIKTCVAEVFQEKRTVNTREREPWLVGFSLLEGLSLLNLTGDWPTRAGTSMNINSGPRPKSRRWSRAIHAAYPEVVGLLYASYMHANQPAVAFYERAAEAITPNPEIHIPLSHPGLAGGLEEMAKELGYDFT